MRKKIIAGNWKMNKTPTEAVNLARMLKAKINADKSDVVFCVPFISLSCVKETLSGSGIALGAQNMYHEDSGAYTGEISAAMLKDMGVGYVILGHSERRQFFGETDDSVNKKTHKALQSGLIPIICVGETLAQREQGITNNLLRIQTRIALNGVSASDAEKLVIAYEPVWAIGTGKTATKEQADEACAVIRQLVAELYGAGAAEALRIQYGGSVKANNAAELFSMPNIDGGLVGGASITEEFERIVNYE